MYLVKTMPIEVSKDKIYGIGEKLPDSAIPKKHLVEFLEKGFIEHVVDEPKEPPIPQKQKPEEIKPVVQPEADNGQNIDDDKTGSEDEAEKPATDDDKVEVTSKQKKQKTKKKIK